MSFFRLLPFHGKVHPGVDLGGEVVFASIDPGLSNFALRIERRSPGGEISTLWYEKLNFGGKAAAKAKVVNGMNVVPIYARVFNYLDIISPLLDMVNVYIFEMQLSPNHSVSMLSQHVKTAIMTRYRDRSPFPVLIEVSSRLKSQLIRAVDPTAKGRALKAASVETAKQLFEKRGDFGSLGYLKGTAKKDDLADVAVQLEAFVLHLNGRL